MEREEIKKRVLVAKAIYDMYEMYKNKLIDYPTFVHFAVTLAKQNGEENEAFEAWLEDQENTHATITDCRTSSSSMYTALSDFDNIFWEGNLSDEDYAIAHDTWKEVFFS
jgi:hypothetical protein